MAQTTISHEQTRIKLLLISLAFVVLGLTFAVLPVQATTTDAGPYGNIPVTNFYTLNLGYANVGSSVNIALSTVGGYRLTIRNLDTDSVLLSASVYGPFNPPPIQITQGLQGNVQVQLTSTGGSSATILNTSITHQTMSYPLQLPGVALIAAGVAIILSRVWRIGISLKSATAPL